MSVVCQQRRAWKFTRRAVSCLEGVLVSVPCMEHCHGILATSSVLKMGELMWGTIMTRNMVGTTPKPRMPRCRRPDTVRTLLQAMWRRRQFVT